MTMSRRAASARQKMTMSRRAVAAAAMMMWPDL
jgi:hypothetical protein